MELVSVESSILLAPVGSTVTRFQTETKSVLDHEKQNIFFFFCKCNGFLRGLILLGRQFLRANIRATDTPDIVISRNERKKVSFRVSLVH